jgi:hypothetical protein
VTSSLRGIHLKIADLDIPDGEGSDSLHGRVIPWDITPSTH